MYKVSYNLLDIRYRNVHRELWALMEDLPICMSVFVSVYVHLCYMGISGSGGSFLENLILSAKF